CAAGFPSCDPRPASCLGSRSEGPCLPVESHAASIEGGGPWIRCCMTAEREFSDDLDEWLHGDSPKTLGDLGDAFNAKSFAVTILMLMFVPALPLPTGGITHVFEVITVFVALQMVIGRRTIWLPK